MVARIRQFQFFGTARVGPWREFRRMREISAFNAIEPARAAADQGIWSDFVDAIGGPFVRQKTHANLWKEITGEINQYDELAGPQIVGIACETLGPLIQVRTRLKVWRLDRSGSALGPVPITVTAAPDWGSRADGLTHRKRVCMVRISGSRWRMGAANK